APTPTTSPRPDASRPRPSSPRSAPASASSLPPRHEMHAPPRRFAALVVQRRALEKPPRSGCLTTSVSRISCPPCSSRLPFPAHSYWRQPLSGLQPPDRDLIAETLPKRNRRGLPNDVHIARPLTPLVKAGPGVRGRHCAW